MGDRVDFAVEVERLDGRVVVRVEGDVDMASADALEAAMSEASPTPHVVIDLSKCTFLDSAGMRVIAATMHGAPRVSVVATDPAVLRILEITALDTMLSVHDSLEDVL